MFSEFLGQEDKLSPAPTVFRRARSTAGNTYGKVTLTRYSGQEAKSSSPRHPYTAGHGIPGVLLPSQPQHGRQPTKTAPAPTTSRHASRQPEPPKKHFRPPETKPPSQCRQRASILTTIPISGGRNCTGRAKTSPKKGAEPRFFLPPKKFGKRSDIFQILMPTAPTRIKPRLPAH